MGGFQKPEAIGRTYGWQRKNLLSFGGLDRR